MRGELNRTGRLLMLCAAFFFTFTSTIAQKTEPPVDKSPHHSGFAIANGIKMHYLDWGGTGDALLLLTGLGDDAHIFDDFAPKFTDRFHVVGLTRRGFGESEKPATGYDVRTRVEDIRAFLDVMKIQKVSLIGHSIAGDEITSFATFYPRRLRKVVYLDAAYNDTVGARFGPDAPDAPPRFRRLILEALGSPEADKVVVKDMPPPDRWKRIVEMVRAHITVPPDYTKLKTPGLAFYSTKEHEVPPTADEATSIRIKEWYAKYSDPYRRESINQFRREARNGHVVEMKEADHYLFKGNTADEVGRRTKEFLLKGIGNVGGRLVR